jgi:hypothetical protein
MATSRSALEFSSRLGFAMRPASKAPCSKPNAIHKLGQIERTLGLAFDQQM